MEFDINLYRTTTSSGSPRKTVCSIIDFLNNNQLSYNLENDIVREYNENVHYSKSYIVRALNKTNCTNYPTLILPYMDFRNMDRDTKGNWTELPRPVIIKDTTAGNTLVISSANFTHTVPCTQGATLVYNLVPGENYQWSESSTDRVGNFTTTGQIRMINIGLFNFRDIGGWPCYDDNGNIIGHIKYGQVYRGMGFVKGGHLDALTYENYPNVVEELMNLGITDDVDLRGYESGRTDVYKAVIPGYPTIDGKKITYHQGEIPAYLFKSQANTTYTYGYTTNKRAGYKNLIVHLNTIVGEGKSSYVHCATGADRTGVFIAILMALLGCSLEDIVKEYELTSLNGMGHSVNLGYVYDDAISGIESDGGYNLRHFLYTFNTSSTTTERSIVNAIVDWVKTFARTDGVTWNEYIDILKTKMIKYN